MRVRSFPATILASLVSLAALLSIATVLFGATPASAELDDQVRNWWGVTGLDNNATTAVESHVFAIEQIGNTIYVGGKFLEVEAAGTTNGTAQPFLAAFHADTGRWIDWWRPNINGPVYALRASPDGSRLFVGGEFTSVNGTSRAGLAALNPATGQLDGSWSTVVGGGNPAVVRALELQGGQLYIGGAFNFLGRNGSQVTFDNAARVDQNSGAIDAGWKPVLDGGGVWGLAASPSLNRVYLTGFFTSVSGVTQRGFAAVSKANGSRLSGFQFPHNDDRTSRHFLHDVVITNGNVFIGGSQHNVAVYRESDWSLRWYHVTARRGNEPNGGGDTQDLEVFNGRVYASCHCWGWVFSETNVIVLRANGQWQEPTTTNRRQVRGLYAMDASSGARIDTFQPQMSGIAGPWALQGHSTDGCLWVGGQFSQVNNTSRKNLTRMCDEAGPGPAAGPPLVNPGQQVQAPLSCFASRVSDTEVRVTWNRANGDNATNFVIRRSRNGGTLFWAGQTGTTTAFNNTGMNPGTYSYTVAARGAAGTSAATTCGPNGGVTLTSGTTAARAPLSCWATRVSDSEVRVTWTRANNDNAANFVIRRSRNGGTFFWAGQPVAPATAFNNTGMNPGTYSYTVETRNASGASIATTCGPNGGVTLGAAAANPVAPISCWATRVNGGEIRVTWTRANNDNATNFVIERRRNGGSWFWATKTGGVTAWNNTNMGAGTYEYRVKAQGGGVNSTNRICGPNNGVTL